MDEAKFANDLDNAYCELLRELRKAKPIGGKSTIITASGTYEIDENYNPPRVVKKETNNAKG